MGGPMTELISERWFSPFSLEDTGTPRPARCPPGAAGATLPSTHSGRGPWCRDTDALHWPPGPSPTQHGAGCPGTRSRQRWPWPRCSEWPVPCVPTPPSASCSHVLAQGAQNQPAQSRPPAEPAGDLAWKALRPARPPPTPTLQWLRSAGGGYAPGGETRSPEVSVGRSRVSRPV